jgi:hypothetical protein
MSLAGNHEVAHVFQLTVGHKSPRSLLSFSRTLRKSTGSCREPGSVSRREPGSAKPLGAGGCVGRLGSLACTAAARRSVASATRTKHTKTIQTHSYTHNTHTHTRTPKKKKKKNWSNTGQTSLSLNFVPRSRTLSNLAFEWQPGFDWITS